MMKKLYLGLVSVAFATVGLVSVAQAHGVKSASRNEQGTTIGQGARSFVRGTSHGIRAAGHATAYGLREAGQSLTGHQGDKVAEARSQQSRERMHDHAASSRDDMNRARGVESTPRATGGGPVSDRVTRVRK